VATADAAGLRGVIGLIMLPLAASCLARASNGTIAEAAYGEFDARQFYSTPVSTALSGAKIGWDARKLNSPISAFAEAGYLGGSAGLDLFSLGAGVRVAAFRRERIELGAQLLLDVELARLDRYRNSNDLVALGVGGYAAVRVFPRGFLTLALSAHAFVDATPPTTCNDGSTSLSTGQGTCSYHGGIDHYNDSIRAGGGLDALVGFRIWFGADTALR
jgi:hypothetical protein